MASAFVYAVPRRSSVLNKIAIQSIVPWCTSP